MFHYNKLVEGISFVTKELGKKYTELVAHYYDLKDKSLKSLESELANNSALLQKESNIEDKLNVYELTSALQIQKFTFDNLEKSLRGLRTNVNALLDSYSIDKVKRVYSAIYIDGLNVSLVINLTSSRHEYRNDLMSFVSIKIPYVINYKPCELTFNVILR